MKRQDVCSFESRISVIDALRKEEISNHNCDISAGRFMNLIIGVDTRSLHSLIGFTLSSKLVVTNVSRKPFKAEIELPSPWRPADYLLLATLELFHIPS